jgi:hypothetical protein
MNHKMGYMENLTQGLVDEILAVVHKYDEAMLLPTALGCLDLAKAQLLQDHMEDDDE